MDMDGPGFFEGPDELQISRHMLRVLGKELVVLRGELAQAKQDNEAFARNAQEQSEAMDELRRRLETSESENSALRLQLTALKPDQTSQLLVVQASSSQREERLRIANNSDGLLEAAKYETRIRQLEKKLAKREERSRSDTLSLSEEEDDALQAEATLIVPPSVGSHPVAAAFHELASLELYEYLRTCTSFSAPENAPRCRGKNIPKVLNSNISGHAYDTAIFTEHFLTVGKEDSQITVITPVCHYAGTQGTTMHWSDVPTYQHGRTYELFMNRYIPDIKTKIYTYLGAAQVVKQGLLGKTHVDRLRRSYKPMHSPLLTLCIQGTFSSFKGSLPKGGAQKIANMYETGELLLRYMVFEVGKCREDLANAMERLEPRTIDEEQDILGLGEGRKRAGSVSAELSSLEPAQKRRRE